MIENTAYMIAFFVIVWAILVDYVEGYGDLLDSRERFDKEAVSSRGDDV